VRSALAPLAVLAITAAGLDGCGGGASKMTAPTRAGLPGPIALTSGWQYLPDQANQGRDQGWQTDGAPKLHWSPVAVPSTFNPNLSRQGYNGQVGWYKVAFTGPSLKGLTSWWVRFDEVRRNARVWLNGKSIGGNADPYAPFALQASSLRPGQPNLLVVRVDNIRRQSSWPEDWWNWGGIVRPVTLEPVGRIALADLGVMPELGCNYRCGDVLVQGRLQNMTHAPLRPELAIDVQSPSGLTSASSYTTRSIKPGASVYVNFRVPVRGTPDRWAPGHPALYKVTVSTEAQGHREQQDSLRVGMRSIHVQGGVLYLNGKRLWLHGAAIHEDMPGRGAALTDRDIATIVSELRSAGANITRAHYLLDDRLLSALDAAGIMVWTQPPLDHADLVLRSAAGRAAALTVLKATIAGSRSHPSVIVNSVGNELSPTADTTPGTRSYLEQAVGLARQLDPTAPVALDTYCYPGFPPQRIYSNFDVIGISSYFGWYTGLPGHSITDFNQLAPFLEQSHARYPRQALVVAEFGAEGRFDGAASTKGSYQFQSDYLQKTVGVLDRLPFMNGSIYWTLREFAVNPWWTGGVQLPPGAKADGIHHKGLLAYNGTEKPAFSVAQRLFADPPAFVH
jgi:hypothetical protein